MEDPPSPAICKTQAQTNPSQQSHIAFEKMRFGTGVGGMWEGWRRTPDLAHTRSDQDEANPSDVSYASPDLLHCTVSLRHQLACRKNNVTDHCMRLRSTGITTRKKTKGPRDQWINQSHTSPSLRATSRKAKATFILVTLEIGTWITA